jgi:hypothetical protein
MDVTSNKQPPRRMVDVPPEERGISHQQWLEHQARRIFGAERDRLDAIKKQKKGRAA